LIANKERKKKKIPYRLVYISRWLHAHAKAHANLSAVFKVA
jgi:hypothetical protein